MRSLLLTIASLSVTILAWGVYGPVLSWGQADMSTAAGSLARLRPLVCLGLAYFGVAAVVPAVLLKLRGETGTWTIKGLYYSLAAGVCGGLGAVGMILTFHFGGNAVSVMPLVFGGTAVVQALLTNTSGRHLKQVGPLFLAGLMMVLIGAVTVFVCAPQKAPPHTTPTEVTAVAAAGSPTSEETNSPTLGNRFSRFAWRLPALALAIVCWGVFGPLLYRGQAAMQHSWLRPLICLGMAAAAVAVVVPQLLLTTWPEASTYSNFSGTCWSLAAGAAAAGGTWGILMAFHLGGKPTVALPLVFGGAPVVNTLLATWADDLWYQVDPFFLAGLILIIAGAALVLVGTPQSVTTQKKSATCVPRGS